MTPIEKLKALIDKYGDDTDKKAFAQMDDILSKISSYDCHVCKRLVKGACMLPGGNHCIRRADDYYGT